MEIQKAIDSLKEIKNNIELARATTIELYTNVLEEETKAANKIEEKKNKTKWIDVKNRLPKEGEQCLVIVRLIDTEKDRTCPFILTRTYSTKKGWRFQNKEVEYWIAIPPPPTDLVNGEYCKIHN